jgi:hypothetical protein
VTCFNSRAYCVHRCPIASGRGRTATCACRSLEGMKTVARPPFLPLACTAPNRAMVRTHVSRNCRVAAEYTQLQRDWANAFRQRGGDLNR